MGRSELDAATIYDDGVAMSNEGRWAEAAAAFAQVIDLEPDDTDLLALAYVSRSVDLILLERVEEAVADVTAAIDLEPDDIDTLALAYVNRSIALSKLERTDDAVADLRIVLELVPQTHELNRQALALLA